jgi:hypothetical protein
MFSAVVILAASLTIASSMLAPSDAYLNKDRQATSIDAIPLQEMYKAGKRSAQWTANASS